MWCPECRAEYRMGFTRCEPCGVELVEVLPRPKPVSGVKAGFRVLAIGEGESDLAAPSEKLEAHGIGHVILCRQPDGCYLPPDAEQDASVPPLVFQGLEAEWLLAAADCNRCGTSRQIQALLEEDRESAPEGACCPTGESARSEEHERPYPEPEPAAPQPTPAPIDPFGRTPALVSPGRARVALLVSFLLGFGFGPFLLRRTGVALICLACQVAPFFAGSPAWGWGIFLAARIFEILLAAAFVVKAG